MNPKMYTNYNEAKEEAQESGKELWDTHQQPERYMVGTPTIEMEEEADNEEWEQLDPKDDLRNLLY